MPGINDTTLVHGVLDLIERSLRKQNVSNVDGKDPWEGTPSALLYREHPEDEWVLTGTRLIYPSGYQTYIKLNRGMTEEEIESALIKNIDSMKGSDPIMETGDPSDEVLDSFNLLTSEEQDPEAGIRLIEVGSHGSFAMEPTIPLDVTRGHYDFEYYSTWRLKNVMIEKSNASGEVIDSLFIHMVYDLESRLIAALVEQVVGN